MRTADTLIKILNGVLLGKERQIRLAVCCLISGGHLLIEDLPGMGKTTLATGLSSLLGLSFRECSSPRTCCLPTLSACRS